MAAGLGAWLHLVEGVWAGAGVDREHWAEDAVDSRSLDSISVKYNPVNICKYILIDNYLSNITG